MPHNCHNLASLGTLIYTETHTFMGIKCTIFNSTLQESGHMNCILILVVKIGEKEINLIISEHGCKFAVV